MTLAPSVECTMATSRTAIKHEESERRDELNSYSLLPSVPGSNLGTLRLSAVMSNPFLHSI